MRKRNEHVCIICPQGCIVSVERDSEGNISEIVGNECLRGRQYALREEHNPVRNISSTVKLADGGVLPVKTSAPISKDKIFDIMAKIKNKVITSPVKAGQIIIKDVDGFGADIVACASCKKDDVSSVYHSDERVAMSVG